MNTSPKRPFLVIESCNVDFHLNIYFSHAGGNTTPELEEENLFARAMSRLGEDDGNAAVEFVFNDDLHLN